MHFRTCHATIVFGLALSAPSLALSQESLIREVLSLPWQSYPSVGNIAEVAGISLVDDLQLLDSASTSRFLELQGNPPRDDNFALAPSTMEWFAVFSFDPTGYVEDDEQLDPDELLRILRKNNESSNSERSRLNYPTLKLDGWSVAPHYDLETRRLEWGTRLIDEGGEPIVNYTIRILGRSGVMTAILVSDPQDLKTHIGEFRRALRGFEYIPGHRYAEFQQGDKMAGYGLAALIVGGAAAAAAKSGVMKGLGKFIGLLALGGVAVLGTFLKSLFRRKT